MRKTVNFEIVVFQSFLFWLELIKPLVYYQTLLIIAVNVKV